MAEKTPKVFESSTDTYTVVKQIAAGGSGIIYLTQGTDGIQWAVKALDPKKATSDKRRRFQNELFFCLKPHHVGLIQIHDHGLANVSGKKTPFYVMPLYAGTLRTLMNQQLDPQKRLQYFIQILHGVDAAHKKGVHHRDIKPENVLFDATHDRMIVSDLGIAHFSEEDLLTAVETRAEQRLANFVYAAPEQRIRGGKTDGRTDIFSLGLILNELYTGVVPHGTGPTQIGNVVPDLAYLDLIVETMIRNNPSDRYAAIDDVLDAIRASGVEFATKQKISVLTKEVIPSSQSDDPLLANPIRVLGRTYDGGQLIFKLSAPVNQRWISAFQSRGDGFIGFLPQNYTISGDTARVRFDDTYLNILTQIVQQLEGHVRGANVLYQQSIQQERQMAQERATRELKHRQTEEERKLRILEALKRT